ncbi:lytic transglycosylase domain-containing protein [Sphingopyxis yananensis]
MGGCRHYAEEWRFGRDHAASDRCRLSSGARLSSAWPTADQRNRGGRWAGCLQVRRPRDNIIAGTAYLRELHDRYGNPVGMLAAYNAGPGRYDEHLKNGRPLPHETRSYLTKLSRSVDGVSSNGPFMPAPLKAHGRTRRCFCARIMCRQC